MQIDQVLVSMTIFFFHRIVIVTHKNSSFEAYKHVGILIQNTCKCLLSKHYNGNTCIVNKAAKDTRLE